MSDVLRESKGSNGNELGKNGQIKNEDEIII